MAESPVFILGEHDAGKTTLFRLMMGEDEFQKSSPTCGKPREEDVRLGGHSDWAPLPWRDRLRIYDFAGNATQRAEIEGQISAALQEHELFDGEAINVFYCIDGCKLFGDDDGERDKIVIRCRADMDLIARVYDSHKIEMSRKRFYIVVTRGDEDLVKGKGPGEVQGALGDMVRDGLSSVGGGDDRMFVFGLCDRKKREEAFDKLTDIEF